MKIRKATIRDRADVRRVHMRAFPEGERELVSTLAIDLLSEKTTSQIISLAAEVDGDVVGHVAFSPVVIENHEGFAGYLLAPLGVMPEHQHRRIGSGLIEYGVRQMSATGVNVVFVYGDPNYYGRFGFRADAAQSYTPPCKLQYPFGWQAIVLNEFDSDELPAPITCVTPLCDPKLW